MSALTLLLLVLPVRAELFSSTPESRWPLLDLLPRRPEPAPSQEPDALFERGEALFKEKRFSACYPILARFLELSPAHPRAELARYYLGLSAAKLAPGEDRDDALAREALVLFARLEDPALRAAVDGEAARLRALLGKKELFIARFYARQGKDAAALARLEGFAAGYPDTTGDPGVRDYLKELAEAPATRELAQKLLAEPPGPAPMDFTIALPRAPDPLPEPAGLSVHLELRNGQVRELAVSGESWSVEAGQLGLAARSPLLGPSPYVNLRKHWKSPLESALDYKVEAQLGAVEAHARRFGGPSATRIEGVLSTAQRLGLAAPAADKAAAFFEVADPWTSDLGVIASVMPQVGRAYRVPFNLFGPVDAVWAATNLTKFSLVAPNTAFNLGAGLRLGFPQGYDMGLFAGYTENFSPIDNRVLSAIAHSRNPNAGFMREASPQGTLALAGPVPGLNGSRIELGVMGRQNADTFESQAQLGVEAPVKGMPLRLRASYKDERGPAIEFGRRTLRAEAQLRFKREYAGFASCEQESITYGGVSLKNEGCLAGLRWTPGARASATIDWLFGGKDRVAAAPLGEAAAAASAVSALLTAGVQTADYLSAESAPEAIAARLEQVLLLISRLPQETQNELWRALGQNGVSPSLAAELALAQDHVQRARLLYAAKRPDLLVLSRQLSDPELWEEAATTFVRAQLARFMDEFSLSLGPLGTLSMNPTTMLFFAHTAGSRASPFAPMTRDDQAALQNRILAAAAAAVGVSGSDPAAIAEGAVQLVEREMEKQIEARLIPALSAAPGQDPAPHIEQALALLPPETAAQIRAQLGPLPQNPQALAALIRTLPARAAEALREHLAPRLAAALKESAALAAALMRRETNRVLLQLLLAAEELDRLTVDHGLKAGDNGTRMMAASLAALDERLHKRVRARRLDWAKRLEELAKEGAQRIAHGALDAVAALRNEADFHAGLTIKTDASWEKLVETFGEKPVLAMLRKISRGLGAEKSLSLTLSYDPLFAGVVTARQKDGSLTLTLGKPARSPSHLLEIAARSALEAR